MKGFEISVAPEHCTGCLRCRFACSELFTGRFSLPASRIRVELSQIRCKILFTDDCTKCGVCADNCLYGALRKTGPEESP